MEDSELKMNGVNYDEIIKKYPQHEQFILAMMQDIQKEYNYIPKEALENITKYLNVPMTRLYGMATFYKALSLEPKGENIIKVCDGTACHVRGSAVILKEIEKELNIKAGQTTEDGKFSIEIVNCLGACALAPVIVINDKYYGKVNPVDVKEIINLYRGDNNE